MALHSDHPFGDRPEDLIEELTRFGLIGPPPGTRRPQGDRLRSKAPEMPVPEIRRTEGGPLPMLPMAALPRGDPLQMLRGGGGGSRRARSCGAGSTHRVGSGGTPDARARPAPRWRNKPWEYVTSPPTG